MSNVASLSSAQVLARLKQHGFIVVSQRGSHVKLMRGSNIVILPHPRKDIRTGTMAAILTQAGLSRSEFDHTP